MRFVGHDHRFGAERFGFMSRLPLKKLHFDPPKVVFSGHFTPRWVSASATFGSPTFI